MINLKLVSERTFCKIITNNYLIYININNRYYNSNIKDNSYKNDKIHKLKRLNQHKRRKRKKNENN